MTEGMSASLSEAGRMAKELGRQNVAKLLYLVESCELFGPGDVDTLKTKIAALNGMKSVNELDAFRIPLDF